MRHLLALFVVLLLGCSDHGQSEREFPSRTVTVNGTDYKYRLFIPPNRDPNLKMPVMLYLHGAGTRGDDNTSQLGDIPQYISARPDRFPFVIVFPQCRQGRYWAGETIEMALKALDDAIMEFNGDEDRVYLAGFSMGANGTWQNGLVHSGKFAALVPIAGDVAPRGQLSQEVLDLLPSRLREAATAPDPYGSFAEGLRNTPIWVFHGSEDDAVSVDESRKVVAALKEKGNANVNYTEYENAGHLIVGRVWSEAKLFEWLAAQRLTK